MDLPIECYVEPAPYLRLEVLRRLNLCMVKSEGTTYYVELSNEYKKQAVNLMFDKPGQAEGHSEEIRQFMLEVSK